MGRHGITLTAYETAYVHLRRDIYNLQLVTKLMMRLLSLSFFTNRSTAIVCTTWAAMATL